MRARGTAALLLGLAGWASVAAAQELRRATVWDLKLGQPVSAQPAAQEFRGFACGANGGPPRRALAGWSDFARCPAETNGLHEVYFEYDDEYEYIARAKDLEQEVSRWAGTTEAGFPVIVSALFDGGGTLRGIRIVTDARPDHRNDLIAAEVRKRADAYLLGAVMAARYDVDAGHCTALPPAAGESAVGERFVKQACEMTDAKRGRRIVIRASFYRKPGQSGVNPQMPSQLTRGQFESSARAEIYEVDGR